VVCFSRAFEKCHNVLTGDGPILVSGQVAHEGEDGSAIKIHLENAIPLAQLRVQKTNQVHLHVPAPTASREKLEELRRLCLQHPGNCPVTLHLRIPKRSDSILALPSGFEVAPTEEFLVAVERLFGERTVVLL